MERINVDPVVKVMLYVALCVWFIVGFIFWIPLLARATVVFAAMIVHATITNQNPYQLRAHLNAASSFYVEGFRTALRIVNGTITEPEGKLQYKLRRVVVEIAWTTMFWLVFLYLMSESLFERLIIGLKSMILHNILMKIVIIGSVFIILLLLGSYYGYSIKLERKKGFPASGNKEEIKDA